VRFAYRRALTREPRSEELDVLVRLVSRQQAAYAKDPKSAEQLLKIGEAPLPQDADAVEVAAWMAAARTIFNLHEFVVRF
jgi:hypothetical protein